MSRHLTVNPKNRPAAAHFVDPLESRVLLSAGQLDPTFGMDGRAPGALAPLDAAVDMKLQSDGKILLLGSQNLARLRPDGRVDRTFGTAGRAALTNLNLHGGTAQAAGLALQSDGKIVVAATDLTGNTYPMNGEVVVARYLPNGRPDPSFGAAGVAEVPFPVVGTLIHAIALQRDGKIVIAGSLGTPSQQGNASMILARLTPRGSLDRTFGTGGEVRTNVYGYGGAAYSLAIQNNGAILVGGSVGNPNVLVLARYRPDGSPDSTFGAGGLKISTLAADAAALSLQPDGKILVATANAYLGGGDSILRFNASGSLDTHFGVLGVAHLPGAGTNTLVNAVGIAVQSNGGIIAVGTFENSPSQNVLQQSFEVSRFTATGALDHSFGTGGMVRTPLAGGAIAYTMALQGDGKVLAAGASQDGAGEYGDFDFGVARYTATGRPDDAFGYHGAVEHANGMTGPIRAIAVQADGKIVVAGTEVPPYPGEPVDAALARYNRDGSIDPTFGNDGKVFLDIGHGAAFDALAIEPNGDIVAGGRGRAAGRDDFAVARFLPSGAVDPSFGTGGIVLTAFAGASVQNVSSLALDPTGGVIAAGTATLASNGTPRIAVARYLPSGGPDAGFGSSGRLLLDTAGHRAQANALVRQPDGKLVIGGVIDENIAVVRLSATGALDPSFGTRGIVRMGGFTDPFGNNLNSEANALALDSAGRIVIGGDAALPFQFGVGILARLLPTGSPDPSFGTSGRLTFTSPLAIVALALQRDRKIVAGGDAISPLVARADAQGLDNTFGTAGVAGLSSIDYPDGSPIASLAIDRDGSILAASDFTLYRLTSR